MLRLEQTALSVHIRDLTTQTLGPDGSPLQYGMLLARVWRCSMPAVVDRIRVHLHREMTNLTGKTTGIE
jgi:hypothetical protein